MKRNFKKHISDEQKEGFKWSMWQVEQLASLEEFKKKNVDLYIPRFQKINDRALKVWAKGDLAHFFEINSRAVRTLINSTMNDLKQAEYAMLRKCNDEYRKIIFNAQTYFVTGSGSLKQAIDMASHDFLSRGINCVVYKDGKHVNIANYAEMSLRTTNKRVRLYSDGEKRKELGIHTVKVSSYGACSKLCQPWQGRVYVDDVYSGGTAKEAEELHLPLLSTAIQGGLFHPNCRHHLSTYYPGTQNDDDGDPRDKAHPVQYDAPYEHPPLERQHRINQLEIQKQKRIALGSMDPTNIEQANQRLVSIQSIDNEIVSKLKNDAYSNVKNAIDTTKEWKSNSNGVIGKVFNADKVFKYKGEEYIIDGKQNKLDYTVHELNVGKALASFGKNVQMNPKINFPQKIKVADYLVDGKEFDLKDIIGNGKSTLYDTVKKHKKQSDRFILDVTKSSLSFVSIAKQIDDIFTSPHTRNVKEIIIFRNGDIEKIFIK